MKKARTTGFKFEQALARVEQIVERMESGEIELDQALSLYREGTELMAKCQAALQEVQRSITTLTRDSQGRLKLDASETEE
ncbi:MAG: exodeoxyribonuclease VII small subunit [Candidatus Edwardsbacteria bacterium]|jgi:exodeoxyribonuclease VII small subunit|nr:exodeoxyribonuclease VII small subunit [Candidatus Edwardsbacteria bacterium]